MILPRRNVLLFHQAALGDFVLTWPIALAAARLWPTNRTIYVTAPSKGELAERAIGVEWRDGDPWHALFSEVPTNQLRLAEAATKSLIGATLIISFVSNGSDTWARNVRALAPEAQLICIQPRPTEQIDRHLTMFHAEQFGEKPDLQAAIGQMVRHVAASGATPRRSAGEAIVIHPGSGGEHKCWPAERFIDLAKALTGDGHRIVILLGEAENERLSTEVKQALTAVGTVVRPKTLVELFDVVAKARLYIGNDSGPTHLAAACGVPTIALFGHENDLTWRPLGPSVRVIKHVPLDGLPVAEVLAAVKTTIEASAQVSTAATVEED